MMAKVLQAVCGVAIALGALSALAQTEDVPAAHSPYVEVTVQVNGLDSATQAIADTMSAMNATLQSIADERSTLSADELAALGELIDKSDTLTRSLERTINSIPAMVEDVREPSRAALTDWLSTTSVQAVDPAIRRASREVKSWLKWIFAMAVVLLAMTALGLYVSARELRQMARVLKSLADDYEIVPRQSTQPLGSAPQRPAPSDGT